MTTQQPPELNEQELQAALEEQQSMMKKLSDVAKAFDVTNFARMTAYETVQKLLVSMAEKDSAPSKEDITESITHLLNSQMLLDQLVRVILRDLMAFGSLVSESTAQVTMNNGRIRAVAMALDRKGLVKDTEFAQIYNDEVLPQIRQDMGIDETEAPAPGPLSPDDSLN
jgi:hypothetical protein